MKNLLFAIVLMFTASVASGATITLHNLDSSDPDGLTPKSGIENSTVIADNFVLQTAVNNNQDFSVTFDLTFSADSYFGFDLRLNNLDEWTYSVTSVSNDLFNKGGTSRGMLPLVFTSELVKSSEVYRILIQGTANLAPSSGPRFLNVTMENIVLSEVPLPAAVWLFGTALLGGLALRRKRNQVKLAKAV